MSWWKITLGNSLIVLGLVMQLLRVQQVDYRSKAYALFIYFLFMAGFAFLFWDLYDRLDKLGDFNSFKWAYWILVSITLLSLMMLATTNVIIAMFYLVCLLLFMNFIGRAGVNNWARIGLFILTSIMTVLTVIAYSDYRTIGMGKVISILLLSATAFLNASLSRAYCSKYNYSPFTTTATFLFIGLITFMSMYLTTQLTYISKSKFDFAMGWGTVILSTILNPLVASVQCIR